MCVYFDGSVQERCNSIANTLELRLSCTNPSILSLLRISLTEILCFILVATASMYFLCSRYIIYMTRLWPLCYCIFGMCVELNRAMLQRPNQQLFLCDCRRGSISCKMSYNEISLSLNAVTALRLSKILLWGAVWWWPFGSLPLWARGPQRLDWGAELTHTATGEW